jgi:hypothetical protein
MFALFLLAQLSTDQAMMPQFVPEAFRGAWDWSDEACAKEDSLTRIEIGPNWMRDNYGVGALQFFTSVTPMSHYDEAIEARYIMGGKGGIRDQQMLLNSRVSKGRRELLWLESEGPGYIDDAAVPAELVSCPKAKG